LYTADDNLTISLFNTKTFHCVDVQGQKLNFQIYTLSCPSKIVSKRESKLILCNITKSEDIGLTNWRQVYIQTNSKYKKGLRERRKHCVLAVVRRSEQFCPTAAHLRRKESMLAVIRQSQNFHPTADPLPGVQESQNLISWRCSLPSPTDPVW